MARGAKLPKGVRYYNDMGKSSSAKGSKHPEDIMPGLETTNLISGSSPKIPKVASPAKDSWPSIAKNRGTENRRGTHPKTLQKTGGKPPFSSSDRRPSNVKVADGLSVPKRVRQPKG